MTALDPRFRGDDERKCDRERRPHERSTATSTRREPARPPEAPLRPAATVMRLARLGSFHPTRLSFVRSLVRRMGRERWIFRQRCHDLDASGFGRIVYEIETPTGLLTFCGFSNALAPEERTDRVIAEKWDTAFALSAGRIDEAAIERLSQAAPRQEAARYGADELVLSRANRSVRLFDKVTAALAAGRQPDLAEVVAVGYLMRTTAVYGNGKFGLADLPRLWRDGVFALPYEAEMLMVYMIRQFSFDLIEHIARMRDPARAVPLSLLTRRALGIGNATGLGMAPFLVGHPMLFNNWILARERALARVRAVAAATPEAAARFRALLDRAIAHVQQWDTDDERAARAHRPAPRGAGGAPRARQAHLVAAPESLGSAGARDRGRTEPGMLGARQQPRHRALSRSGRRSRARHGLAGARPGRSRHEPRRAQGPDRDPL